VDKYVGDAIRARFSGAPGESSAVRAIRAGLAMQDALAGQNTELDRRYGVRLSLRVGINTGTVVSGAAGDPRAAALMLGNTVTLAEQLEKRAAPNTVLVGERTRVLAQDIFVFTARAIEAGATPAIAAHVARRPRKHAGAGVDTESAQASGGGASLQIGTREAYVLEEQRKIVTILFADVSSSEPLGSRLDEAQQGEVLAGYFAAVAGPIQRFGGTIDKYIGDAVMAVFGAPVSHEDDGARAIAAGLGIKQAIERGNVELERRHGLRLAVRIGINTGEVVAGLLPGEIDAYTVTGDAVNTAQRIESVAPANEVLVSATTQALARHAFVYEAVAPLKLKGKAEPVQAFRVLGRERRASRRSELTLLGRESELERLYAAFREVAGGQGAAIHVWGEPGVGKTRLIAEFLSGVGTAARVRARASSYEQATPYALVADLVRGIVAMPDAADEPTARAALAAGTIPIDPATRDAAVAVLLEILGYDVPSPLGGEAKRRLLLAVLRRLAEVLAGARPLVIVIEDLHWSDATSLDLLKELASDLSALRWLLLSTSREPADAPWAPAVMGLESLPADAAGELLDRLAPDLDVGTRATVLERTEGNPFFIEEVARAMAGGVSTGVPLTIQDLLEARLDALARDPGRVAKAGAVVGRSFWARVVAEVVRDVALDPALETLARGHLVSETATAPERTFTFAHALVQEVAYRTQLLAERRRAHGLVGDAYGALFPERLDEFVDQLAFHYRRGEDDAKARTWLLRAGHRAKRLYANTEALDYFTGAIARSADSSTERGEADEALADVYRVLGRYEDAASAYRRALETAVGADLAARARLRRKGAVVEQLRGNAELALATFQTVLAELPPDERMERARTLLSLAELLFRRGNADAAIIHLTAVLADQAQPRDDEAAAEALKLLGTIHSYRGELGQALKAQEQSLAAYVRIGDVLGEANVHNNIGRTERRRSRHGPALDAYARSLTIRERIGDQLGRIHSHANIAEIHFLRGELADAERHYLIALDLSTAIGYALGIGASQVGLGATKVARGDPDAGIAQLETAIEGFERDGQRTLIVEALRDLTDGQIAARSPLAVLTAERGVRLARELALPELLAIALQALGNARISAGEVRSAIAALEESRSLLGTTGDQHELARTLALLGRAYRALPAEDPRSSAAAALLDAARTIFIELNAALDLARLDG